MAGMDSCDEGIVLWHGRACGATGLGVDEAMRL